MNPPVVQPQRDAHSNAKHMPDEVIRLRRARLQHHPDVVAARKRIQDIAGSWDVLKQGPLRGFDCVSLRPTEFREQLKRNFGILLGARELGALMAWYDRTGEGRADCNAFTKDFWLVGRLTKKAHIEELTRVSQRVAKQQHKLLQAKLDRMDKLKEFNVASFTEEQKEAVLDKIAHVASYYDLERQGPLRSLSEGNGMTPAQFREQLKVNFGLKLGHAELGALMAEFDHDGDGSIDGPEFMYKFSLLGRQKRLAQLTRKRQEDYESQRRRNRREEAIRARLGALNKAEVNWTPSEAAQASAMAKVTKEAAFYDRNRNGGLESIVCGSLDPTGFKTQLRQTFGIRLSAAELGALFKAFDLDGSGTIEGSEFLMQFFRLGREARAKKLAYDNKINDKIAQSKLTFTRKLQEKFLEQSTARVTWPEIDDDPFVMYTTTARPGTADTTAEEPVRRQPKLGRRRAVTPASTAACTEGSETSSQNNTNTKPGQLAVSASTEEFLRELAAAERQVAHMQLLPKQAAQGRKPRRKKRVSSAATDPPESAAVGPCTDEAALGADPDLEEAGLPGLFLTESLESARPITAYSTHDTDRPEQVNRASESQDFGAVLCTGQDTFDGAEPEVGDHPYSPMSGYGNDDFET